MCEREDIPRSKKAPRNISIFLQQLLFEFTKPSTKNRLTAHQVGESTIVIVESLRGRRADILDVGESTLDVGKQKVGETTMIA